MIEGVGEVSCVFGLASCVEHEGDHVGDDQANNESFKSIRHDHIIHEPLHSPLPRTVILHLIVNTRDLMLHIGPYLTSFGLIPDIEVFVGLLVEVVAYDPIEDVQHEKGAGDDERAEVQGPYHVVIPLFILLVAAGVDALEHDGYPALC